VPHSKCMSAERWLQTTKMPHFRSKRRISVGGAKTSHGKTTPKQAQQVLCWICGPRLRHAMELWHSLRLGLEPPVR
jgi:hypothetical protein